MPPKHNAILLTLKKEPLELIDSIEPEITTEVISNELLELQELSSNSISISETNSNFTTQISKKKGRKRKIGDDSNVVKRSFNIKWLNKPELKDWLTIIPEKPYFVSCRWCKALLRAHLHDLKKHAISKKHRKHSLIQSNLAANDPQPHMVEADDIDVIHNINSESTCTGGVKHSLDESLLDDSGADGGPSEALKPVHIGFIGCGNMAQALLSGFLSNGLIEANNVIVSAPSNRNLAKLRPLSIRTTHNNQLVLEESDMVYLAVKPHVIPEVIDGLEAIKSPRSPLFISLIAGLTINRLEAMLDHVVSVPRVVRIMPNTPCMVLQGCCVYSFGMNVKASEEKKAVKFLLASVGLCEEVPETQIDAVCGVAGSGPAYIFAAIEAMADGGVKMGLPRPLALALAAQTVKGAASMVIETGKHPAQLKDDVCSPSGTTIHAMHVLEKNGFRNTLISAVEAAALRSKELA